MLELKNPSTNKVVKEYIRGSWGNNFTIDPIDYAHKNGDKVIG